MCTCAKGEEHGEIRKKVLFTLETLLTLHITSQIWYIRYSRGKILKLNWINPLPQILIINFGLSLSLFANSWENLRQLCFHSIQGHSSSPTKSAVSFQSNVCVDALNKDKYLVPKTKDFLKVKEKHRIVNNGFWWTNHL